MRDYAETRLQMASSDYLNGIIRSGKSIIKQCVPFPGLLCTHPANETSDPKEAMWAMRKGQRAGTPDWLLWWSEVMISGIARSGRIMTGAIELKVSSSLTYEQKHWRDLFIALGGKYSVCKTVAEIRDSLISWGLECKNMNCIEPRPSKAALQRLSNDWQKP